MSLPQLAQLEFEPEEIVNETELETVHATFDWDFEQGDFRLVNGRVSTLTGREYLKVWIQKALRTVRNSFIYAGVDYGSEHHSLIGTNYKPSFTKEEYKRYIREALLNNSAITNVSSFSFSQEKARMTISFDVTSVFGTVGEEVII